MNEIYYQRGFVWIRGSGLTYILYMISTEQFVYTVSYLDQKQSSAF